MGPQEGSDPGLFVCALKSKSWIVARDSGLVIRDQSKLKKRNVRGLDEKLIEASRINFANLRYVLYVSQ